VRLRPALEADGEDVWSWRLEVGVKPAELSAGDGVKQNLITGESTEETVNHRVRECRDDSGGPVVTTLVCFLHLHARLRVR
jgi:hypothetical protein